MFGFTLGVRIWKVSCFTNMRYDQFPLFTEMEAVRGYSHYGAPYCFMSKNI